MNITLTTYTIFFEYAAGGTDRVNIKTTDAVRAECMFRDRYEDRYILSITPVAPVAEAPRPAWLAPGWSIDGKGQTTDHH